MYDDAAREVAFKRLAVFVLALSSVCLGILSLRSRSSSVGLHAFASFLLLTGVQVLSWLFGIRIELFGTAAEVDDLEKLPKTDDRDKVRETHRPLDPEMEDRIANEKYERTTREKYEKEAFEHQKEFLERKKELMQREVEVAELQSKLAELLSKVREEQSKTRQER